MPSAASARAHVTVVTESGEQIEACRMYTMSQLNQQTAQVLEEVNSSGRPAVVTRHGRFVALITPLAAADVESTALSQGPLADRIKARKDAVADGAVWSSAEVAARLDALD